MQPVFVESPRMVSNFLQMQAKSSVAQLVFFLMDASRQGQAQSGISLRD